ncbi:MULTISPECIES: hypothetical protein [unclassified Aureispira]|uniref:hypothetical protein n=1 Tax=unclassified Aureispira TaxID=2649989 RepID=UPI00069774C1|nr:MULTISPECIES: hypothetical protein [unclassified Aureispira]WMX13338.1 hypothetical protein QP953_21060 [Aureispira sp. CCB-E]
MKHRFYLKTEKEQQQIQIKIAITAILFNLALFFLFWTLSCPLLSLLFVMITLSIIAPFFDTPSLVKKGVLVYRSPLFLTEREKNGIITIHGGTLFDYYYVLDRTLTGQQRTKFIVKSYLDGLLNLIEEYENLGEGNLKVRGTSYIINERTAKKIGLKKVKTDTLQSLILGYNYPNLICSYSLSKAKLSFPNLKNIQSFEGNIETLAQHKAYLLRLRRLIRIA